MRATEESGEGLGVFVCVRIPVLQVSDTSRETQGLLHAVLTTYLTLLEGPMSGHYAHPQRGS